MSPWPMLPVEVRIETGGGEVGVSATAELVADKASGTAAARTVVAATVARRHRRSPLWGGLEEVR